MKDIAYFRVNVGSRVIKYWAQINADLYGGVELLNISAPCSHLALWEKIVGKQVNPFTRERWLTRYQKNNEVF